MYRVYLPICVHINVHVIPSILIFSFVIGLPAIQSLFLFKNTCTILLCLL